LLRKTSTTAPVEAVFTLLCNLKLTFHLGATIIASKNNRKVKKPSLIYIFVRIESYLVLVITIITNKEWTVNY
jgi:hypothetical protein